MTFADFERFQELSHSFNETFIKWKSLESIRKSRNNSRERIYEIIKFHCESFDPGERFHAQLNVWKIDFSFGFPALRKSSVEVEARKQKSP